MIDDDYVTFDGVDPETGERFFPPLTYTELAHIIKRRQVSKAEAVASQRREDAKKPKLGGRIGENIEDIKDGGWAVVLHKDEEPEVRKALDPLIAHRATQIEDSKRVKVLTYSSELSTEQWLEDLGVTKTGDLEPWNVPSYLLLAVFGK